MTAMDRYLMSKERLQAIRKSYNQIEKTCNDLDLSMRKHIYEGLFTTSYRIRNRYAIKALKEVSE